MPRPDMKIMFGLLVGFVTAILYMLAAAIGAIAARRDAGG